jgi:hypothetical protein
VDISGEITPGSSTTQDLLIAQDCPGVDIDCHTVTQLVERALEALDDGRLDEVRDTLLTMKELISRTPG